MLIKYKCTFLWNIIRPLVMVSIYAFILSGVLSSKLPGINNRFAYSLYLLAGMIPWVYYNDLILKCSNIFVGNAHT